MGLSCLSPFSCFSCDLVVTPFTICPSIIYFPRNMAPRCTLRSQRERAGEPLVLQEAWGHFYQVGDRGGLHSAHCHPPPLPSGQHVVLSVSHKGPWDGPPGASEWMAEETPSLPAGQRSYPPCPSSPVVLRGEWKYYSRSLSFHNNKKPSREYCA